MARHALTDNAQALRREMTPQERHLWYDFLRALPVRFRRQKVLGRYIVDFYCAHRKIVIELDGGQHYESAAQQADLLRDQWLHAQGILVLRYTNLDIDRHFDAVCQDILNHLAR